VGDLLAEFSEQPSPGSEPPVLTLTERNGFVLQSDRFKKRLALADTSRYKVVRRNDIAFNPYLLWAGAVAQNTIVEEGVISPLYPTFRVRSGHDARFVARLLLAPTTIAAYDRIAFGSVPRRRRSSTADFLALEVGQAPPLAQQRRIAAILDAGDALRMARLALLASLDALLYAAFDSMFGDVVPHALMGEVAEIQGGLQVSAKRSNLPLEAPYVRVANVHRGRLDLSEVKTIRGTAPELARTRLAEGDLLFVEGHANPLEVGRVARWLGDIRNCVHQNHIIRARVDQTRLLPAFAEHWLNTDAGAAHFRRAGKTTSGLHTISAATVRSAPIAIPSLALQQTFVRLESEIRAQRSKVERALATEDELFASLQARAFSGRL
jgi:type I restriction enzyme S subunit